MNLFAKKWPGIIALLLLFMVYGCKNVDMESLMDREYVKPEKPQDPQSQSVFYERFYQEMVKRAKVVPGTTNVRALDALPKDPFGEVHWTAAVLWGFISPKGSLDPNVEEEQPLDLNVFIEAKVPLMANVLFPHSIHTYWLSCNNCHPKIFIPEAGANPITMEEIFKGQWCGRCHGKVAFNFWPRENCVRCHIVLKGSSLESESFK